MQPDFPAPLWITSHSPVPFCPSPTTKLLGPYPSRIPAYPLQPQPTPSALDIRTSGPRSSTEPTGKPVLNLNFAEMRRDACWGKGWWRLREVLFPGPLKSLTPNTPNKFQVEVLSSEQQASPSSHFWLLRQSTPRSFQTPVSSHYSFPGWQFSLLAHSCSA